MAALTLDTIDGVIVDPNEYLNEVRTLRTLGRGLQIIYNSVKRRELAVQQQMAKFSAFTSWGLDFDGTDSHLDVIACYFHWFGVSVINYARLIGFIKGLHKGDFVRADLTDKTRFPIIKASVKSYVVNVADLQPVLVWRNKIAGHFAITDPNNDDNIATLQMSVVFPVSCSGSRYVVNEFGMTTSNASGTFTSELPRWSVTEISEKLVPRYWPNAVNLEVPEPVKP